MKSDVWSLGCIVYELCELKSPFRNENEKMSLMDLFNNITKGTLFPYKKGDFAPINKKFSDQLRNIINQMIVVDPTKRLDSGTVVKYSQEMLN